MTSEAIGLERQDTVQVDADVLEPYGGTALFWRTRGIELDPDRRVTVLLEEDDSAAVFAAPGALVITGTDADLRFAAATGFDEGALVITGSDVTFHVALTMAADPGAIDITGTPVASHAEYFGGHWFGRSYFGKRWFG